MGGCSLTWQWGLGLVKYRCQRRCRGQTAGKRLGGGQAIGSTGTWVNLGDNQHTVNTCGTHNNSTFIPSWLPVCLRQSWLMAATERTRGTGGALRRERCYTSLLLGIEGCCTHPHPVWEGPWGWSRYLRDQNYAKNTWIFIRLSGILG